VHAHDVGAAGARHPDVAEAFAAGNGLVPTDSVLTTLFVAGSIRESVFEPDDLEAHHRTSISRFAGESNLRLHETTEPQTLTEFLNPTGSICEPFG
jgi:hypothetical protein